MQRVWIIGASAGIGEALARHYAAQGAQVLLSARDGAALTRLAAELPGAEVLVLDLASAEALQAAVASIPPGSLDVILCTAALYQPGRLADVSEQDLSQVLAVNLLGSFRLAQAAPRLLRPGGQLVLFGSVAGYLGLPMGQPYSATKAAIINLAESLRVELAPRVDVRLVCPGFVRTRLTDLNAFKMPALITPEAAAEAIFEGLQGRRFELHFPRRFTLMLKLLQIMPYRLALWLTAQLKRS